MLDYILRFLIGGVVVSLFATLGDVFRPKSFAGLFGAAPSIALATLGLTVMKEGKLYAAVEARSMMLGAAAFCAYAVCVTWVIMRYRPATLKAALGLLPVWLAGSVGVCLLIAWVR